MNDHDPAKTGWLIIAAECDCECDKDEDDDYGAHSLDRDLELDQQRRGPCPVRRACAAHYWWPVTPTTGYGLSLDDVDDYLNGVNR